MIKYSFEFEKKAYAKSFFHQILAIVLMMAPVAGCYICVLHRPIFIIPGIISSVSFYIMFIPFAFRSLWQRKKYRLFNYLKEMSVSDRKELDCNLKMNEFFSIGEMCFCDKYLYFKSSFYVIPYSQLTEYWWQKKHIQVNGVQRLGITIYFRVVDDSMTYYSSLTQSELPKQDVLLEKMQEIVCKKNSEVVFRENFLTKNK